MSKIWVLEHTDHDVKYYWSQCGLYQVYVADINSATIFHNKVEAQDVKFTLLATKPKLVQVNIVIK